MNRILFSIAVIIFNLFFTLSVEAENISNLIKLKLDLMSLNLDTKIAGEKFHSIEYIYNLYEKNNFQQFWTKPENIDDAISALTNSYEDGLLPADYHIDAIRLLQNEMMVMPEGSDAKYEIISDLDLLVTDGVIFYADHLLYGKIDPVALVTTWNFGYAPIPDLNLASLNQYITNHEIPASLEALRPDMHLYDTLITILARYRDIAGKGGWETILAGGKIEPGSTDPRIPAIRKRLLMTGELSNSDSISSNHYDEQLEQDIKAFQSSHGLDADGIIGIGTFRELNVPVEKRIEAIRINLERLRWVARNLPESYIIVNIAAYWLMMLKDGQIIFYTPVVVGKPLNETPVFRDRMRYIVFNPTWTQPTSIIKNETVPKLKKDSTYLEKNHMVLLDTKGNLLPTAGLDFKNLSESHFPYLVRQEPGPWNQLGKMKFMFPNDYDIYLHDTPSKSLFSRAKRAYSHGCIRVGKPVELAELLLKGSDYDLAKIYEILKTNETTRVNLPQPVDILLMYWTCGIGPDGKLFFVPDIYERDLAVLRELDKPMN